jgi:hypothetical protein
MRTPPGSEDGQTRPVHFPDAAVTANPSAWRGTASALSTRVPSQSSTLATKPEPSGYNVITYSPRLPVLIYDSSRSTQPFSSLLSVMKSPYRTPVLIVSV